TGFFIDEACPLTIAATVRDAVSMWHNERNRIDAMRRAAMRLRFGWEKAATEYLRVYDRARSIAEADQPERSPAP
ncbi:MAG: hypothetical protein ACOC2D_21530, partial [Spirochaetota bacterium]